MSATKSILKATTTLQAAGLAGYTAKNALKNFGSRQTPRKQLKNLIKTGTGVIIGTALIAGTADVIEGMS